MCPKSLGLGRYYFCSKLPTLPRLFRKLDWSCIYTQMTLRPMNGHLQCMSMAFSRVYLHASTTSPIGCSRTACRAWTRQSYCGAPLPVDSINYPPPTSNLVQHKWRHLLGTLSRYFHRFWSGDAYACSTGSLLLFHHVTSAAQYPSIVSNDYYADSCHQFRSQSSRLWQRYISLSSNLPLTSAGVGELVCSSVGSHHWYSGQPSLAQRTRTYHV